MHAHFKFLSIASYGDTKNSLNLDELAAYSFRVKVALKKYAANFSETSVIPTVLIDTVLRRIQ